MTDHPPDFEETRKLMRSLGFAEAEARSTLEAFGSWFINRHGTRKIIPRYLGRARGGPYHSGAVFDRSSRRLERSLDCGFRLSKQAP